ncbi:hypothetical protein BU15DRAFT_80219 [Melanogaster broomeanus]|nr:hypothetical protein BU15DRAFT_80219 [Melanogaster broomeanus]
MSFSQISIASTPRLLWDGYVEYLWNYQSDSWVGRTASCFRILAVILVLPVVILTLLDVTSYVIARTLGIVDDVKASTSDNADGTTQSIPVPASLIPATTPTPGRSSEDDLAPEEEEAQAPSAAAGHPDHNAAARAVVDGAISPQAFFAGEEDMLLSGVGVFSPAVSVPPSPPLSRTKLRTLDSGAVVAKDGEVTLKDNEGIVLRRRLQGA